MPKKISAVHPGEILRKDFLEPHSIKPAELAQALNLNIPRINDIVLERRAMSANTALRLARFFGNSPEFWLNLQVQFDLTQERARDSKGISSVKPLQKKAETTEVLS